MLHSPNTNVAQWKLRRIAPRALQVLARHKDRSLVLGTFDRTLSPRVERFIELYDRSRTDAPSSRELAESREAIAALRHAMSEWLTLVARDLPGFKAQLFDMRSPVPEDVFGSVNRFLNFVRSARVDGEPLPYAENLETSLAPALESALKEWAEVQEELAAHQALLAETRRAAHALNRELVAFRRSLATSIGTNHRDYRTLRTARSTNGVEFAEGELENQDDVTPNDIAHDDTALPEGVIPETVLPNVAVTNGANGTNSVHNGNGMHNGAGSFALHGFNAE